MLPILMMIWMRTGIKTNLSVPCIIHLLTYMQIWFYNRLQSYTFICDINLYGPHSLSIYLSRSTQSASHATSSYLAVQFRIGHVSLAGGGGLPNPEANFRGHQLKCVNRVEHIFSGHTTYPLTRIKWNLYAR